MPPFWRALRDSRLWDLSVRRSLQKMIGTASLPRRLKENSQQSTAETSGLRWEVLTPVRGVCALSKTVWYTIQGR